MEDDTCANTESLLRSSRLVSPSLARVLPYILLLVVFLVVTIPLILKPGLDVFDSDDETNWHYPTILRFTDQIPHVDLADYPSATTPLYHLVMASVSLVCGSNVVGLRLVSSLISLACLLLVYGHFSRRGPIPGALYFALLFFLSPYFIGPAVRLSTDNMALGLAILSILAMDIGQPDLRRSLLTNVLVLLTVLTRQLYAWLIGAYVFTVFLGRRYRRSIADWATSLLPVLIPMAGGAFFVILWKGLAPPEFSVQHTALALNWDAPVYAVSLLGLYGSFFASWYFVLYKGGTGKVFAIVVPVVVAIVYLALHPVSGVYDKTTRGGALWLVASALPELFSSSIVYWVLFPIGLFCTILMIRYLALRRDYVMSVCFVLWMMANMVNNQTIQKYYEPLILFFLGHAMVSLRSGKWYSWIGPCVLLAVLAAVDLVRFF
jgi:hypothetical protein